MPIIEDGWRSQSVKTPDEIVEDLEKMIEALTPEERAVLAELAKKVDASGGKIEDPDVVAVYESVFEKPPVDPKTFIEDEYYFGKVGSQTYPRLKEDFIELFSGNYSEALLLGSIGWGKTHFSLIGLSYVIYLMSCMRMPQESYGLSPGSNIAIALLSTTIDVAKRTLLSDLENKLNTSPYFTEEFPFQTVSGSGEIRFPKKIVAVAGSTSGKVIGANVFAGIIDEASFMPARKSGSGGKIDQAERVYSQIMRRMKSRFQRVGKLPGILYLVSSAESQNAFIERRLKEVKEKQDTSVFVRHYNNWETKPRERFSEKTFKIAVGNEMMRSIIDPTPQEEEEYKKKGLRVIEVPWDFRNDFVSDLEGSLRDIAGIATATVSPFIHNTEAIRNCISKNVIRPVDRDTWPADRMLEVRWDRIIEKKKRVLPGGGYEEIWVPKVDPDSPRFVHIDPALVSDRAGVVIGHVAEYGEVYRRGSDGETYVEVAPFIYIDLVLGVDPPDSGEILLSYLRSIVYAFAEHGFPITWVTMDGYQSADSIQQFNARGIRSEVLSVDRTMEPYETLKSALYEGRIAMYRNDVLVDELMKLQRVIAGTSAGGPRYKVDHPSDGSKDIADALAAVVYKLTKERPSVAPMEFLTSNGSVLSPYRRSGVDEQDAYMEVVMAHTGGLVPVNGPKNGGVQDVDMFDIPFLRG